MKFLAGFIAALVVGALAAFLVIISGAYNVAATVPETALERLVLSSTMRHSVRARADAQAPRSWTEEQVKDGFQHYGDMCVFCHAAPGKERGPASKGMRPQPPDLAKAAKQWSDAELFWIVKNGIKMSGMPAFGRTHRDDQIWNIVAFVSRLPQTSAQEFKAMEERFGKSREPEKDLHQ
jgi:mono/diheme cytochrome c family protein